jgi:hypothetical protein
VHRFPADWFPDYCHIGDSGPYGYIAHQQGAFLLRGHGLQHLVDIVAAQTDAASLLGKGHLRTQLQRGYQNAYKE